MISKDIISALERIDTPAITNAVATYDDSLGIYDAWFGKWYTDTTIKCMYPECGPRVGYVATVTYSLENPYNGRQTSKLDLPEHLDKTNKPIILCAKQDFPPELKNRVGLFGGIMANRFSALGVTGVISDGPMRDYDEIKEETDIQMLVTGLTPAHGNFAVRSVGTPVKICGMNVMPGDMVHMDLHGACKFPEEYAEVILRQARDRLEEESAKKSFFQGEDFSLGKWKEKNE